MAYSTGVFAEVSVANTRKHPVRLTALIYLRAALLEERYEECRDCISIALEFGATGTEIRHLLEDPRRFPTS